MPSLQELVNSEPTTERATSLGAVMEDVKPSQPEMSITEAVAPQADRQEFSTFKASMARGTDYSQATLYAATKALGDVTGFDVAERWGQEGLERNLIEAAENPPRIERFDDIEDLADFGTYVIEAVGEQVPQLAADLGIGIVGGGASLVARATIGKAMLRKLSVQEADAVLDNIALARFSGGFKAGFYTGIYGQVSGETELELQARDIDNSALALAAGVPKTLLERLGLENAILNVATKRGVPVDTLSQALNNMGRDALVGMLAEGSTEGLQGVIDNIAVASQDPDFDITSRDNLLNLADQSLKGAIVGGTFGGTISGARSAIELNTDRNGNILDSPTPESPEVLDAQIDNVLRSDTTSDTVVITPGAKPSPGKLESSGLMVHVFPTGFAIATRNPEHLAAAQNPEIQNDLEAQQVLFGQFINSVEEGKKPDADQVVQVRDANGVPVREVAVSSTRLEDQIAALQNEVPEGGSIEVTDQAAAVEERAQRNLGEFQDNMEIDDDDLPTATVFDFADLKDLYQVEDPNEIVLATDLQEVINAPTRNVEIEQNPRQFLADKNQTLTNLGYVVQGARQIENEDGSITIEGFKPKEDGSPEDSLVRKLNQLQTENPFVEYSIVRNEKQGRLFIQQRPLDTALRGENTVQTHSSAVAESVAVRAAIARAKQGRQEVNGRLGTPFQRVDENGAVKLNKDGKPQITWINIPSMLGAMLDIQRGELAHARLAGSARTRMAVVEALAQLYANGYRLNVDVNATNLGTLTGVDNVDRQQKTLTRAFEEYGNILQAIDLKLSELDQFEDIDEAGEIRAELETLIGRRKQAVTFLRKRGFDQQGREEASELVNVIESATDEYELQIGRPEAERDITDPSAYERSLDEGRVMNKQIHRGSLENDIGAPKFQRKGLRIFGKSMTRLEANMIAAVQKAVGLSTNLIVTDLDGAYNNSSLRSALRSTLADFRNNPELVGRTVGFGNVSVIIVRNVQNHSDDIAVGTRLLTLGHELGHVTYRSYLNGLSTGVKRALENIHQKEAPNMQFNEWMSDKFAAWATAQARGEANNQSIADRIFKAIRSQFNKIWITLRKHMPKAYKERFARSSEFEAVFVNPIIRSVYENQRVDTLQNLGQYEDNMSIDPQSFSFPKSNLRQITQAIWANRKEHARNLILGVGPAIATGDWMLRHIGATRLADMFYHRSQSQGEGSAYFSILQARITEHLTRYHQRLPDDPQLQDELLSILEAETPINQVPEHLKGHVKNFRQRHAEFRMYLNEAMGGRLGNINNHFPRIFDVEQIMERAQEFDQLIADVEFGDLPNRDEALRRAGEIRKAILDQDGVREFIDSYAPPGMDSRLSRGMHNDRLSAAAASAGFLHNAKDSLDAYVVSGVKRAEFERRFGKAIRIEDAIGELENRIRRGEPVEAGHLRRLQRMQARHNETHADAENGIPQQMIWDSNYVLKQELAKLPYRERVRAQKIVDGYMGRLGLDMPPSLRRYQSWIMVLEFTTTLAFATLASIPDIGNIMIRAKDPLTAMRGYARSLENTRDAVERAEALGVLHERFTSQALLNSFGSEFFDRRTQKVTDVFFKTIGQTYFTNITRTAAATMAEVFLETHSTRALEGDARSARYLDELGVTPQQVQLWQENGKPYTPVNDVDSNTRAIRDAMTKFVDESILRPNPAQRPTYASDPRFALIWQLKSFFYSFGTVIVGGIQREMASRRAAGDSLVDQSAPLVLASVVLLPLAALGLELREAVRAMIADLADEPYTPQSDHMDTGEYLFEIFDRAGGLGPATLLRNMFTSAEYGNSVLMSVGGPAFQHTELLVSDANWETKLKRTVPLQQLVP